MLLKSAGLTDVEDLVALRFHNEQINCILKTTNDSKKKSNGTDDIRSYEQSLYSAMAESPVSSNCTGTIPSHTSRAKLFPNIPKTTVVRGMGRGKLHRKNMREHETVSFSRVLKDKLSQLNPRTRRGKEAQLKLNNYQNKVKPNGGHRFPNAKDAMF
jgi:hypothetical protein